MGINHPMLPGIDASMTAKARHVRQRSGGEPTHQCSWPGCTTMVPVKMWGCRPHWYKLPAVLRNKIWAAYRPGQETDGRIGREYAEVYREVQEWIAARA